MKIVLQVLLVGLLIAAPHTTLAKVTVFACEPEWAALAQEIGGDKVKTFAATHAKQDPHHIRARPSLIAKIRNADLLFCSGAGLEAGWLPILLKKTSNQLQPGKVGYLMASDHIDVLEKPVTVDRSMGDIHPEGNPHIHLNPYNILTIAGVLTNRLIKIDPSHAAYYQNRYQYFTTQWKHAITQWKQQAAFLKGARVVVHHKSLTYLLDWLGMKNVGSLEPVPGIPPTASHLENLLQQLKAQPAHMILRTGYDPDDASLWLTSKTNIPAITLPYTVGGDKYSKDLFGLFDRTLTLMRKANER